MSNKIKMSKSIENQERFIMDYENIKLLSEKYSNTEKYKYFMLLGDSTGISTDLFMILWEQSSVESTQMDLQLFHQCKLIERNQNNHHELSPHFMTWLREHYWQGIDKYRRDCVDKIQSHCNGKLLLMNNEDEILWKILFECCHELYDRVEDSTCEFVKDLREWHDYAAARGLSEMLNEMKFSIRRNILDNSSKETSTILLQEQATLRKIDPKKYVLQQFSSQYFDGLDNQHYMRILAKNKQHMLTILLVEKIPQYKETPEQLIVVAEHIEQFSFMFDYSEMFLHSGCITNKIIY